MTWRSIIWALPGEGADGGNSANPRAWADCRVQNAKMLLSLSLKKFGNKC